MVEYPYWVWLSLALVPGTDTFAKLRASFSSVKKIYPIYYDLYLEEKPRRLFDQISVARDLEIKGLILYDLDYLTKEYYDALKLSLFLKPDSEENEKESLFKKEFSNDEKEQTTENIEKE